MIITVLVAAVGELCWDEPIVAKPNSSRTTLKAVILNLLGVQSGWIGNHVDYSVNGPTWFISILMICYIFFFAITRVCSKDKKIEDGCIILMILLGIFLYDHAPELPLLYESCGRGYVCFFSGVLVAKIEREVEFKNKRTLCLLMGILGMILFIVTRPIGGVWNHALVRGGLFNLCLLLTIINLKFMRRVTDNVFFKYLGELSFGIFLWNIPVLIWVKRVDELLGGVIPFTSSFTLIAISGITILIAILFNRLIDARRKKYK